MVEFNLLGIPVRIETSFWLTIALLGYLSSGGNLLVMALFVIAAFISILVHEMGHALMVRKYRLPTEIILSSFGGYATFPPGILSRAQVFLVTLAGPLLQAIFGGIIYYIYDSYLKFHLPPTNIHLFFIFLIWISLIWALFNCLPIIPYDGGRMLEALLGPRRIKTTIMIGIITAGLAIVWGLLNQQPFIVIFMGLAAWQNYQLYQHHNRW